jgi:hypothetical protein
MTQGFKSFMVFVAAGIACCVGYSYATGARSAENAAVHQCMNREIAAGTLTIDSQQLCRATIRRDKQLS